MSTLQDFVPRDLSLLNRWGNEETLKAYLNTLKQFLDKKKYQTRRAYVIAIKQFFIMHRWICPRDITIVHAQQFKATLLTSGKKETTALWRISAMSSFMKMLTKTFGPTGEPLALCNPFKEIDRADINPEIFRAPSTISAHKLLSMLQTEPHDIKGLRDRAIIALVIFTKCNCDELAKLRVRDISDKKIVYRCSKRERTAELPDMVYDAIKEYWLAAGRTPKPDEGVFLPIYARHTFMLHGSPQRNRNWKKEYHKTQTDPIGHETVRAVIKQAAKRINSKCSGTRDLRRVCIPTEKVEKTLKQYVPLPGGNTDLPKLSPEKQLIDAYVRMLEIEEATADLSV